MFSMFSLQNYPEHQTNYVRPSAEYEFFLMIKMYLSSQMRI